jgi:hypothetical protein
MTKTLLIIPAGKPRWRWRAMPRDSGHAVVVSDGDRKRPPCFRRFRLIADVHGAGKPAGRTL